ncbi:MAG: hypothetical protein HY286_15045 [Planctomycetes bacterium]|nr:hypothetical protein [Planctomycetota bacterium]
MPSPRRILIRLALVLLGVFIAIVAVELALQTASWFHVRALRQRVAVSGAGKPLVAFVGDSNIYGLYVKDNETIDCALQTLAAKGGARGIATINKGYPGSASWAVLEQAKEALALHPVAIVARTGINNLWSLPTDTSFGPLANLRIVKLWRTLSYNWSWEKKQAITINSGEGGGELKSDARKINEQLAVVKAVKRDGTEELFELNRYARAREFAMIEDRYDSDLHKIAELCEAANVKCIFATYLASSRSGFSDIKVGILKFEGYHGARVADCSGIEAAVTNRIAVSAPADRPGIASIALATASGLILTKDSHPTPIGYQMEACVMLDVLKSAGIATDAPSTDLLTFIPNLKDVVPILRAGGTAAEPVFLYEGNAKDRVQVLFGRAGKCEHEHVPIPLDLFSWRPKSNLMESATITVADASGHARISFNTPSMITLQSATHAIAYVHRGGMGGAAQVVISEPLELKR